MTQATVIDPRKAFAAFRESKVRGQFKDFIKTGEEPAAGYIEIEPAHIGGNLKLSKDDRERLNSEVLAYRYWRDEPGADPRAFIDILPTGEYVLTLHNYQAMSKGDSNLVELERELFDWLWSENEPQ